MSVGRGGEVSGTKAGMWMVCLGFCENRRCNPPLITEQHQLYLRAVRGLMTHPNSILISRSPFSFPLKVGSWAAALEGAVYPSPFDEGPDSAISAIFEIFSDVSNYSSD